MGKNIQAAAYNGVCTVVVTKYICLFSGDQRMSWSNLKEIKSNVKQTFELLIKKWYKCVEQWTIKKCMLLINSCKVS